jgi:hypothetical protein
MTLFSVVMKKTSLVNTFLVVREREKRGKGKI